MTRSPPSAVVAATLSPQRARSANTPHSRRRKSCGRRSRSPATSASTRIATSRYWSCNMAPGRLANMDASDRTTPGSGAAEPPADEWLEELTPRQIVAELDKYIVGQNDAKRAVAIALRNRWRRQRVDDDLREEIMPNNIILIGPTGVGKTEIARRLAQIGRAHV